VQNPVYQYGKPATTPEYDGTPVTLGDVAGVPGMIREDQHRVYQGSEIVTATLPVSAQKSVASFTCSLYHSAGRSTR
jgi:hypothetical protein